MITEDSGFDSRQGLSNVSFFFSSSSSSSFPPLATVAGVAGVPRRLTRAAGARHARDPPSWPGATPSPPPPTSAPSPSPTCRPAPPISKKVLASRESRDAVSSRETLRARSVTCRPSGGAAPATARAGGPSSSHRYPTWSPTWPGLLLPEELRGCCECGCAQCPPRGGGRAASRGAAAAAAVGPSGGPASGSATPPAPPWCSSTLAAIARHGNLPHNPGRG